MRKSDRSKLAESIDTVITDIRDGVVLFKVAVKNGKLKEISSRVESRKKFLSTLNHSPEDPMSKFSEQFVTTFSTAMRRSYPGLVNGPHNVTKGSAESKTRDRRDESRDRKTKDSS